MTNTASSFQFLDPQKAGAGDVAAKNGSVIGAGLVLKGSIAAVGDVLVAGAVDGNVSSEARVVIAVGGLVSGKVDAMEIVVAGKLLGDSVASKSLALQGSAEVRGDVTTPQIVIEPGATFVGRCSMPQAAPQE
jgi:cytoskeletal protein CcmA (bactofilin family)